jgi:hypothetical protein
MFSNLKPTRLHSADLASFADRAGFTEIKAAYPELRDVIRRIAEERSEKMAAPVIVTLQE